MGLRERKKEQTRDELAAAAIRLFIERGYDATPVEDIAAAVEVSPRTFFRYYPTKEDVVVELLRCGAVDLHDELASRPDGECLADALRAATHRWAELSSERAANLMQLSRVVRSSPVLRARLEEERRRGVAVLAELVADRIGVSSAKDDRPALIATLAMSVISAAIERWSDAGGEGDLGDYLDVGFDLLKAGLPNPVARPRRHRTAS